MYNLTNQPIKRLIVPIKPIPVTIPGFEHYLISYFGGIVINTRTKKVIKGWLNENGYRRVKLVDGENLSQQYVQRLVALAYIPNHDPENKTEVNHLDRNRDNNDRFNLEWVTRQENIDYIYNRYTKKYDKIELNYNEVEEINSGDWEEVIKETPF